MKTWPVAGVGEILFDVIDGVEELGGAPVNFAYHVNKLGGEGLAVSTIGDDQRGKRALSELAQRGLTVEHLAVVTPWQTGYVEATLGPDGVATYRFPADVAWDHLTILDSTKQLAPGLAAVCFGSLVQRGESSRRALNEFLALLGEHTLKVFDVNLRQNFYSREVLLDSLQQANILKLNEDELPVLASMLGLEGDELTILGHMVDSLGLRLAALTRGGRGSLLVSPEGASDHPGIQAEAIVDTIGAGDAFTATVTLSMLRDYDLATMNEKANRVAAWVCSQKGAMPPMPESFKI